MWSNGPAPQKNGEMKNKMAFKSKNILFTIKTDKKNKMVKCVELSTGLQTKNGPPYILKFSI